jgi:hypothetical protein
LTNRSKLDSTRLFREADFWSMDFERTSRPARSFLLSSFAWSCERKSAGENVVEERRKRFPADCQLLLACCWPRGQTRELEYPYVCVHCLVPGHQVVAMTSRRYLSFPTGLAHPSEQQGQCPPFLQILRDSSELLSVQELGISISSAAASSSSSHLHCPRHRCCSRPARSRDKGFGCGRTRGWLARPL